jgi:hypothetical protein
MTTSNRIGILATAASVFVAIVVLRNTDSGRVGQEGILVELIAFIMFIYAGVKGSRWWLTGMLTVILFWVAAAHVDVLWK